MTDEQEKPRPELTDKQKAFIDQYFICGFNATEAAKRAGYGGDYDTIRSIGSENLSKPNIREKIDKRMSENHMTADEIISRIEEQAKGTMEDFLSKTGRGDRIDLTKARKAGKMHLLKSYSKGKQGVKIELYSSKEALELLGKHQKLFTDQVALFIPEPIKFVETVLPNEEEDASDNGNS